MHGQSTLSPTDLSMLDFRTVCFRAWCPTQGPLRGWCCLPSCLPTTHWTSDTTPLTATSRSSQMIQPLFDVLSHLHIKTREMKEIVVNFQRKPIALVNIVIWTSRWKTFLGIQINRNLLVTLYRNSQDWLYLGMGQNGEGQKKTFLSSTWT